MSEEIHIDDNGTDAAAMETSYSAIPVAGLPKVASLPDEELLRWMDAYRPPVDAYASLKTKTGKVLFVDRSRFASDEGWWFVGDVHGDLRALEAIVSHVRSRGFGPERVVFLGDMFDRNLVDGGMDALRAFLTFLHDAGDRVLWLAGNHDAILTYDEASEKFKVSTNRSELAEYLNGHPELHEFGRKLISLISRLPIALYFSDGIVVSHGGVPHVDVIDGLASIDDLEKPDCVNDFLWGRMTSARFKFPDRTSRGHEIGYEDFAKSSAKVAELAGAAGFAMQPRAIVCGHQHLFTDGIGYQRFERYNEFPPSVCLYSSFVLEPASAWGTKRRFSIPCALHWAGGRFEICGFEPVEDGPLHSDLMAEWQERFDAERKAMQEAAAEEEPATSE